MTCILITTGSNQVLKELQKSKELDGVVYCSNNLTRSTKREIARESISLKIKQIKSGFLPSFTYRKGEETRLREWLIQRNCDTLLVFSMPWLLPDSIFKLPALGCFNLHPSYLPEYRGPAPVSWSLLEDNFRLGMTVHRVESGEDTGAVLLREHWQAPHGIRHCELIHKHQQIGARMLLQAKQMIKEQRLQYIPQPKLSPTRRAKRIDAEEYDQLINWKEWPIERLWRLLRAQEGTPRLLPIEHPWHLKADWTVEELITAPQPNSSLQERTWTAIHSKRFVFQASGSQISIQRHRARFS